MSTSGVSDSGWRGDRGYQVSLMLLVGVMALVGAACEYNPATFTATPSLAKCDGVAATIGVGWVGSDGDRGATYTGTAGDDVVVITNGPVTFDGLGGDDLICVNATGFAWGAAPMVVVHGGDGDDVVLNFTERTVLAYLGNGDDSFTGGEGRDLVSGGPGADSINAGAGDDVVWGSEHVSGEQIDCGADGDGSGDLYLTAEDAPAGVIGCEIVESGGGQGEPILVATTEDLEQAASDPANANRSVVVWPGDYLLENRLTMPDGLRLLSGAGADSTTIDCRDIPIPPGSSYREPLGCIEVNGHVDALTVTDGAGIQNFFASEWERMGVMLRNGGSVRDSQVSRFGVGIAAFVDRDGATAHFVWEDNDVTTNFRGTKAYSVADGAIAALRSRHNSMHHNVITGFLVQAGGEGGAANVWGMWLERNAYDDNGESGIYLLGGDESLQSDDNVLLVASIHEHATGNLNFVNGDLGDYVVGGSFRIDDTTDPHDRNQVSVWMAKATLGTLVVDAGLNRDLESAGTDNHVSMLVWSTEAEVVQLSNGRPLPAGTVTVAGSVATFLANNDIGTLQAEPAGAELATFFTAGS